MEQKLHEAENEIQYLQTQVMNRDMENENIEEQLRESNQKVEELQNSLVSEFYIVVCQITFYKLSKKNNLF